MLLVQRPRWKLMTAGKHRKLALPLVSVFPRGKHSGSEPSKFSIHVNGAYALCLSFCQSAPLQKESAERALSWAGPV